MSGLTDEELDSLEQRGLTDEELEELAKGSAPQKAAPSEPPPAPRRPLGPPEELTTAEKFLSKLPTLPASVERGMRGFVQGAADPSVAIAQMVAPKGSSVDKAILEQEMAYAKSREGHGFDVGRLAGNIAAPTNLMAASAMPRAATLAGAMRQGATLGALGGVTTPTQDQENFWTTKAKQGGLGLVAGAAVPAVVAGTGRMLNPNLSDNVRLLHNEGVQMTPGQMLGGAAKSMEDKLTSVPIVGDAINNARRAGVDSLNTAAYNRALGNLGLRARNGVVGEEAMANVHRRLSTAYDDVTSRMHLSNTPAPPNAIPAVPGQQAATTYTDDLLNLRQNVMTQGGIPPEYMRFYDSAMRDVMAMATPQGNMSGTSANNATRLLLERAQSLNAAAAQNPWWNAIRDALQESRQTILNHMERQNPQLAGEFRNVRNGWANYAILRDAAAGAKNQTFSPGQLSSAVRNNEVRQAGRAAGRGRLSENRARMQDLSNAASDVLPSSTPDSGTAGRLLADAAVLGGGVTLLPEALIPIGLASTPYLPGIRRGVQSLIAGGQGWRRPLAGALSRMSPRALSAGAGSTAAKD